MSYSPANYTGNGSTTNYSFSFPYLKPSEIQVFLNNVQTTAYTLINTNEIQFTTAPGVGVAIAIRRTTGDDDTYVAYQGGSTLRAEDLNLSNDQLLHLFQEREQVLQDALRLDNSLVYQAGNRRIANLATPTQAADAVTKAYADAVITQAQTSASAAATSATNAGNSATAAANSATAAATSATNSANSATASANSASQAATLATGIPALLAGNFTQTTTLTTGHGTTGTPTLNHSWNIARGAQPTVGMRWNETVGLFQLTNDGSNWAEIVTLALIDLLYPIGSIIMWAGPGDPVGGRIVVCDGRALNRAAYPVLFNLLNASGLPFGAGDGTFTFNIPDFRATTPVGRDIGLATGRITSASTNGANVANMGGRFGAQTHTLTINEMPSHQHGSTLNSTTTPGGGGQAWGGPSGPNTVLTSFTGGGLAHSNTQPSMAINFAIRIL